MLTEFRAISMGTQQIGRAGYYLSGKNSPLQTASRICTAAYDLSEARDIPIQNSSSSKEHDGKRISGKGMEKEEPLIDKVLYENHILTNCLQKLILSVGASAAALLDPKRHDMVATLGETTGYRALTRIHSSMLQDPESQSILNNKPRINSETINLEALAELPDSSFGYAYVKFLRDNNVTPDSRLPVQFVDDPDLAYVMQRYREVHDLMHTILGMPTNMLGEVAVKWVEGLQTGLPMCLGGALFGPLRFRPKQRQKYLTTYLPWAIKVAKEAKPLMNIYYEQRWEQPLYDIRAEFHVAPPPAS